MDGIAGRVVESGGAVTGGNGGCSGGGSSGNGGGRLSSGIGGQCSVGKGGIKVSSIVATKEIKSL